MQPMEADKNERRIIEQALTHWEQSGMLTPEKAGELRSSVTPRETDRQQIAQYFFFIALFCTLLAFGAIFLSEKLLEKIKAYFAISDIIIALITAALSVLWFWYTGKKRRNISMIAYEIYMVLGGLSVLTSVVYFCKEFGINKTSTAELSIALPVLAVLALFFHSRALWIGTLITAVGWFGAFSTWQSTNNLFLGMNYPMRYTVFGVAVLGIAFAQRRIRQIDFAWKITYIGGLAIIFTGLWGVSIFGNYNSLDQWQQVRQIHVLMYSIIFGLAAAASFFLGIKYKDDLARDFGILFLIINLYTRYFEYFWDTMNKGIFFLVLAITFGLVGWLLERKRKPKKANT